MGGGRTIQLRSLLVCAVVLLVSCVGSFIAMRAYDRMAAFLYKEAIAATKKSAEQTSIDFADLLAPVHASVRMLALNPDLREDNLADWMKAVPGIVEALRSSTAAVSFYIGDQEGDLFFVGDLDRSVGKRAKVKPAGARYLVYSVKRGEDTDHARYLYLDARLQQVGVIEESGVVEFDPRDRPWYQQALAAKGLIRTDPYKFFISGEIGSSVVINTADKRLVIAADLRHRALDELLVRRRMTTSSRLVLLNDKGQVLAADRPEVFAGVLNTAPLITNLKHPAIRQLSESLAAVKPGSGTERNLNSIDVDGQLWRTELLRLPEIDTDPVYLGIAVPEDELLRGAQSMRAQILWETFLILLLAVPLAAWGSGYLVAPISRLTRNARGVRNFDFSGQDVVNSNITEVRELSAALSQSNTTLARFMDILRRLSGEPDLESLLPTLLQLTSEACHASGALLYMRPTVKSPVSLVAGRWKQQALNLSKVDQHQHLFAVAEALEQAKTVVQPARENDCRALSLPPIATLNVPLFNRQKQVVGVLVLFNDKVLDSSHLRFIEVLSGFAALALETHGLMEQQKALFESLIQLVASAIDAKSPYTGGHCERVPEAAKLLAEATCAETQGPYAGFNMSAGDWHALHIGAWLHDCGKVTTPEYVVDKATKLETIYDRIHEIRLRFEVLKRDAQIDYLTSLSEGVDKAQALQARDAQWQLLDDEFSFVARCNTGSEYLGDEQLQRLETIAERRWLRTLDDRLGISGEERVRKEAQPEVALPVWEQLLADRPEHKIARPENECFDEGNRYGFTMQIPQYLYDRGELKNLSIRRGTLTAEERYKINEHIIQTIKMLNALPFPSALEQVPEIAGGHHERIDGKGYPCGLTGEQLSPQAKMMAIADVFEALTARDRPYKPSKTLSQALRIMSGMSADGHLDAELLSIFIRSGACLHYAERFLASDQIDCRDLLPFLPVLPASQG